MPVEGLKRIPPSRDGWEGVSGALVPRPGESRETTGAHMPW